MERGHRARDGKVDMGRGTSTHLGHVAHGERKRTVSSRTISGRALRVVGSRVECERRKEVLGMRSAIAEHGGRDARATFPVFAMGATIGFSPVMASSTSSGLARPIFRLNRSTDSVRIWLIFTRNFSRFAASSSSVRGEARALRLTYLAQSSCNSF